MAKPTTVPRWATGGTAEVTEPTEAKKDQGWTPGEKPPAQYWNWWRKGVSDWLAYLNGLTNEALTWAAKHTFQAGASSPVAPAAANDLVNKTYADAREAAAKAYGDGLITALKAAANTWSARQTLNGGATVPAPVNATDAASKAYADGLAASLTTPWTDAGLTYPSGAIPTGVQYCKTRDGWVFLRGSVRRTFGAPASDAVLTLPVGFRPQAGTDHRFATYGGRDGVVALYLVPATGVVMAELTNVDQTVYLEQVVFYAG